jgi:putative selenate reductase molybdopterin-binding subunit
MAEFQSVGRNVRKIDAISLATGTARFTDDFETPNVLYLELVYSPYAHAEIDEIDTADAERIPGVVDVLCYKNVPRIWHTTAGQGYPEPSPYDNVLFDRVVRFVGDRVALVAAETPEIAHRAVGAIRVTYRRLPPVFTTEGAMRDGAPILHHHEEHAAIPVP